MKKPIILLLFFVTILLVSGCVQQTEDSNDFTLKEIVNNPSSFINKEIKTAVSPIEGTGLDNEFSFHDFDFNYQVIERNREGKPITIYFNYEKFYCSSCTISGKVRSIDVCEKERYCCRGDCELPSNPDWKYLLNTELKISPNDNLGSEGYRMYDNKPGYLTCFTRCKPGTEDMILYYIDVTDAVSLDE